MSAAWVSAWIASTRLTMSAVAVPVSAARSLTSLATTANPRPASPARAASIVALRASIVVWPAMPRIDSTTSPMRADESARRSISWLA